MATSARERQSGMREGEGNGDGRICIGRYRASSFCFVLLGVTCLAISICGSHANPGDQDRTCKQGECNTRQIPEAVRTGLLSRVDGLLSAVDRVMDQTLDCLETLSAGIVGLRSKDADFKEAEETVQRVVAPARHCRKSDGEPRGKEQVGYALSLCACSAMPRTDVCYTIPATGARTAQVTSILFLTPTKTKRVSNILTLAKAPRPPTERSRTDGLRRACQHPAQLRGTDAARQAMMGVASTRRRSHPDLFRPPRASAVWYCDRLYAATRCS
eukprot:2599122-Rhodomonas_salina.1